jgi:hypothetical protein
MNAMSLGSMPLFRRIGMMLMVEVEWGIGQGNLSEKPEVRGKHKLSKKL